MHSLLTITWDVGRGIDLGFLTLRYYSLLFAAGFVLGYYIMKKMFKEAGVPQAKLDTLLTYVVIATIVGARLGHVFFYEWDYYSQHPMEILMVWKGGLASHGAAVAIIIAIIIYSRRELKKPTLWMLDRLVITIALAGALIRLGNWFNSEIYGDVANSNLETVFMNPARERITAAAEDKILAVDFKETDSQVVTDSVILPVYEMQLQMEPGYNHQSAEALILNRVAPYLNSFSKENRNILFPEDAEVHWDLDRENVAIVDVMGVPRHPTQLYEAFGYLLIFFILYRIYLTLPLRQRIGFIFGSFLVLIFGFRLGIEFLKENQVAREEQWVLNTGQWLSIPLVLAGLFFMFTAKKKELK